MDTESPLNTSASFMTRAYHLDQPGFFFSLIREKRESENTCSIVLQGEAGLVISITDSPIAKRIPADNPDQSIPEMVRFSPTAPG